MTSADKLMYALAIGVVFLFAVFVSLIIDEVWRALANRAKGSWTNDIKW